MSLQQIPIIMPQLGESIAEATVVNYLVPPGGEVRMDQDIIEVETSKATMAVTARCGGRVKNYIAKLNESYAVGAVLGHIEATREDAARAGLDQPEPPKDAGAGAPPATTTGTAPGEARQVTPTVRGLPVPASAAGASYMSPRMKARMAELGLHAADLAGLAGSGAANRVTIDDLEKFLSSLEAQRLTQASPMRVAVADAMRRSWTRPLATVGLSARIDAILAHRKTQDPKPGPALYALRALALALGENSAPAGRLIGSKIAHPPAIDIGFAVEADDGVLVPVLRGVDRKPVAELTARYNHLIKLAHQRKLPPEASGGSIATVTNFGTFGLVWATPIPLPEQTLVLGLGAGRKAPFWDEAEGRFVPVTEASLTLSFDHRVLDGGAAGRLLARVAALLQTPETL